MKLFSIIIDPTFAVIFLLSLHVALPISTRSRTRSTSCGGSGSRPTRREADRAAHARPARGRRGRTASGGTPDRKSTRLNSSHMSKSYADFCLKKKRNENAHNDKSVHGMR